MQGMSTSVWNSSNNYNNANIFKHTRNAHKQTDPTKTKAKQNSKKKNRHNRMLPLCHTYRMVDIV